MIDTIVTKKITYFFDLIRINKPIGFLLLMWPCWFALANLQINLADLLQWYLYFLIGAFLMRSAGCIINDLIDINLDKNIERTRARPLTSNKLSVIEALMLLLFLLILSFFILLQFSLYSIFVGLISIPLIILYPLLKRYTYWPQIGLGIVFSWGILIVSIQFNDTLSFDFILLYIGCVFWTIAYDTIYAYQDLNDDVKNDIKSTAVLFREHGKKYVFVFYSVFFILLGFIGYNSSKSFISLVVIIALIFGMGLYLNKWNMYSRESSNHYFKFNNLVGLFCFMYLLIF